MKRIIKRKPPRQHRPHVRQQVKKLLVLALVANSEWFSFLEISLKKHFSVEHLLL
jgi:hypothetical protein